MRKFSIITALVVLLFATVLTTKSAGATDSYNIYSGPNHTSRVVLSFDDCPDDFTQFTNVIAWAKTHDVGLVLAPTGQCVENYLASHDKNIAILARGDGQYIINHSYDHTDFTTLTAAQIRSQVNNGAASVYVRPPYGAYNDTVKNTLSGMSPSRLMWLWNVDTEDWTGKTQTQVVNYVVANSNANNTVLMHMQWNGFSVPAISAMIKGLNARGLSVCRAYHGGHPTGPVLQTPVWWTNLNC